MKNLESENLSIIWIEWGRKIPKYLENNIYLHNLLFPDLLQYLISDFKPSDSLLESRVKHVVLEQIPKSSYLERFDEISEKRAEIYSQKNFWIGTTRRFFLLYDFMHFASLSKAIHVESDNVLLNLGQTERLFTEKDWSIAFPLQSSTLGCGSIFLVRDLSGLRDFLSFVLERWKEPSVNDMTLLGDFSKESGEVKVLPSWPSGDVVFDPGAYGKYFLGSDARNFRFPTRKRGVTSPEETSLLNSMSHTKISIDKEAKTLRVVVNGHTELMNLHIHSKVIPKKPRQLRKFIRQGISGKRGYLWHAGKIDLLVILERLLSRVARILGSRKDIRFR